MASYDRYNGFSFSGFTVPPIGNIQRETQGGMIHNTLPPLDMLFRETSKTFQYSTDFDMSNGSGSNSGYYGNHPSTSTTSTSFGFNWNPGFSNVHSSAMSTTHIWENNWDQNRSAEMGSSEAPRQMFTMPFAKWGKKRKRGSLALHCQGTHPGKMATDQAQEVGNVAVETAAQTGSDGTVKKKKKKLKALNIAQETAAMKTTAIKKPAIGFRASDTLLQSGQIFKCTLCRFQTEDEIEQRRHFRTGQHLEVMTHLSKSLPKKHVDFIKEYLDNDCKVVSGERHRQDLPIRTDYFKGIGQEHFLHRVDAAHCSACNVYLPDDPVHLRDHIKSNDHVLNRKIIYKQIRVESTVAANKLFKDEKVSAMLDRYLKGDNPFIQNEDLDLEYLVAEEDDSPGPSEIPDNESTYTTSRPQTDVHLDVLGTEIEDAAEATSRN
uniref:Uncharacterized protein n=1 Tax=Leptobrachium leishanense TaxID=445787 RepID=A0A8C5RAT5_9ANUR